MFLFTDYRPVTNKLSITEHEYNPSIFAGPSEGHFRIRYVERRNWCSQDLMHKFSSREVMQGHISPYAAPVSEFLKSEIFEMNVVFMETVLFQTESLAHPAFCLVDTGNSFPGVKRSERQANHSHPSSA
jgi:hypothetical protein